MLRKAGFSVLLFVFLLSLPLLAGKVDDYRDWLNQVGLIITDAEKAEFKILKKDEDRKNFIALFWARRDPTPQDEKNELRDEFYKRLEYVKKAFIYGYKHGTETDMGKVYLFFGEPLKVIDEGSSAQVWAYASQPWMNYQKPNFNVVFTSDGIGFVLDTVRTEAAVVQSLYAFPKVILRFPELKKVPEYKKVLTFSPDSFEARLIEQAGQERTEEAGFPFEHKVFFTKAENVSAFITLLVKVGPGAELGAEKVTFFGRLKRDTGSSDFRLEKELRRENDYSIAEFGFPNHPGSFKLLLGFYSPDKKRYSVEAGELEIPDYWNQELGLSSLIASPQVVEAKGEKKGEFDLFSLGRYALTPFFSQEYTKEDFLNVFYYIYNLSVDEEGNCALLIEFELKKGEKIFKMSPQEKTQKLGEGAVLLEGTQIPLAALPETGTYELTVKATDKRAGKSVSQKLKFILNTK